MTIELSGAYSVDEPEPVPTGYVITAVYLGSVRYDLQKPIEIDANTDEAAFAALKKQIIMCEIAEASEWAEYRKMISSIPKTISRRSC